MAEEAAAGARSGGTDGGEGQGEGEWEWEGGSKREARPS
jgi:hypothetical protein